MREGITRYGTDRSAARLSDQPPEPGPRQGPVRLGARQQRGERHGEEGELRGEERALERQQPQAAPQDGQRPPHLRVGEGLPEEAALQVDLGAPDPALGRQLDHPGLGRVAPHLAVPVRAVGRERLLVAVVVGTAGCGE